jgi:hypothetical protein
MNPLQPGCLDSSDAPKGSAPQHLETFDLLLRRAALPLFPSLERRAAEFYRFLVIHKLNKHHLK